MQRRLSTPGFAGLVGGGLLLFCAAIFVSGQHIKAREAAPAASQESAAASPSDEDAAAMAEAAGILADEPAPVDDGGAVAFIDPEETAVPIEVAPAAAKDGWTEKLLYRPVPTAAGRFEAQGYQIVIEDLMPVEADEKCTGGDGQAWFCGAAARTQFRNFLRGRALTCSVPAEASAEPVVTRCSVGGEDIGSWLAAQGWARAADGGGLAALGSQAQDAGRGIFGNKPALPAVVVSEEPAMGNPLTLAPATQPAPVPLQGDFPPAPAAPTQ